MKISELERQILQKFNERYTSKSIIYRINEQLNNMNIKLQNSTLKKFSNHKVDGGGLPRADILDLTTLGKPADLPKFGTSSRGSRIRRLRYLNNTIIAVEEIWLDSDAGEVRPEAISDSLYHYYQKQLGFWISRAEDRVSIGAVPDWSPNAFPLQPGTVTGYIERMSWSDKPDPVEFSRTWFDTDKALYVQRLK